MRMLGRLGVLACAMFVLIPTARPAPRPAVPQQAVMPRPAQHNNAGGLRAGIAQETVNVVLAEDAVVRRMELPPKYDDKGKVVKYTSAELKELKGDSKLQGYQGDVADIKVGSVVQVVLRNKPVKKKDAKPDDKDAKDTKAESKNPEKKPADETDDADKPEKKDVPGTKSENKSAKKPNPTTGGVAVITGVITKVGTTKDHSISMRVEVPTLQAANRGGRRNQNNTLTLDTVEISLAYVIATPQAPPAAK